MEEAGGSVGMTDEMGWPVRMLDGKRMCARPGPGHYGAVEEFRIDGYCSCECRDMHDLEEQIERLERELATAKANLAEQTHFHRVNREGYVAASKRLTELERENAELRETLRFRSEQRDQAESNADGWEATAKEAMQREEILRAQLSALRPAAEAMERLEKWAVDHPTTHAVVEAVGAEDTGYERAVTLGSPLHCGHGPTLPAAILSALAAAEEKESGQ